MKTFRSLDDADVKGKRVLEIGKKAEGRLSLDVGFQIRSAPPFVELVKRIRQEGFTVLIVEQNVGQVLEVVDRAYLLEAGRIKLAGPAAELKHNDFIRSSYLGL